MPVKATYPGVYVEELPSGEHPIPGVATSVTVFVGPAKRGPVNRPVSVRSYLEFSNRFGGLDPRLETGYAVQQYFANGGKDAWVVRVAQKPSLQQIQTALKTLDRVDLLNLLVLPGVTAPAAIEFAAAYCTKRRAFLIVDAPAAAKTPAQVAPVVAPLAGDSKRNAAVYYPWIRITDPLNAAQPRLSPPSGTVAGLYARTDATRGVWKAPAGTESTLVKVEGLEYTLTDAENAQLNPLAVNVLREFSRAFVAWGARTLQGTDSKGDEYKYVPVRRLALYLEESIYRGTQWVVFEPNDEPLWAQIRLNVGAFLFALFRQGAFQGGTPKDAYFVKCDRATTTQDDINRGIVNFVVGFAPLKPAEYVIIRFQQFAGQT
jgi:phage tail sheath protein FI